MNAPFQQRISKIERGQRFDWEASVFYRRDRTKPEIPTAVFVAIKSIGVAVFVQVDRERKLEIAIGDDDCAGLGRLPTARECSVEVRTVNALALRRIKTGRIRARPDAIGVAWVEGALVDELQQRECAGWFIAVNRSC